METLIEQLLDAGATMTTDQNNPTLIPINEKTIPLITKMIECLVAQEEKQNSNIH